ncbi:MAG: Crp/Fnr family transcriptional regulator [Pyrinomonadaceae bacterium]
MKDELIIKNITRWIPLSNAEIDFFTSRLIHRKIRRKQYLLQAGDVCRHYTFVNQGCLRLYNVDTGGVEHILQFAPEDFWIADLGSFYEEVPSSLYIDAHESSEVLQIAKPDLIATFVNHPSFDRVFRIMMENAFIKLQKRVLQGISSTAEERYLSFVENYPQLVNRLSQIQIASFIGITPEFLSKIRKNLSQKKPANLKQVQ